MQNKIIKKLEEAEIFGCGGACFPTALKWKIVKDQPGKEKYIVCNGSEGEPGVHKDEYILKHHADELMNGIKIGIDFLKAKKGILYLNPSFYKRFNKKLSNLIGDYPIEIFKKDHTAGYIGGEETTLLNHIEGKTIEPRLRPPFPTVAGLWGKPTIVNNIETLYNISQVIEEKYDHTKFHSINGDCVHTGVYKTPNNWTIEKILKETNNYPDYDFFVQVCGDASGTILNSKQLRRKANKISSITIYSTSKHKPIDILKNWASFFKKESCGQCTPCREGTLRLHEELNQEIPNWETVNDLLDTLEQSSLCGLGKSIKTPFETYKKNVLNKLPLTKIKLPGNKKAFLSR